MCGLSELDGFGIWNTIHIYIYIYMYACVCMCVRVSVYIWKKEEDGELEKSNGRERAKDEA